MNSRLLEALIELKEFGPQDDRHGICWHLDLDHREEFRTLAKGWPEHSGYLTYPVPVPPTHESALSPMGAWSMLPLWRGEYGDARRRLLDWVIEELQQHAL